MKPAFLSIHSSLVRPLCLAYSLLSLQIFAAPANASFEFRDGDRVVLLGDTLIEREQSYAFLEQRLTVQFPERHVIFRNLGWSADTPAGESRAGFDFNEPHKVFEKADGPSERCPAYGRDRRLRNGGLLCRRGRIAVVQN